MERLKDVRRQTVRQWPLAPHEQLLGRVSAFARSCILHSAFEIALCFSFCEKLVQIKRIGLSRI
jgi:hypothetical protein